MSNEPVGSAPFNGIPPVDASAVTIQKLWSLLNFLVVQQGGVTSGGGGGEIDLTELEGLIAQVSALIASHNTASISLLNSVYNEILNAESIIRHLGGGIEIRFSEDIDTSLNIGSYAFLRPNIQAHTPAVVGGVGDIAPIVNYSTVVLVETQGESTPDLPTGNISTVTEVGTSTATPNINYTGWS